MFTGSEFSEQAKQAQALGVSFPTDNLPPIIIEDDLIYLSPVQKLDKCMDQEIDRNKAKLESTPARFKEYKASLMKPENHPIPTYQSLVQEIQSKPLLSVQKESFPVPFELYRKEVNYASIKRSTNVPPPQRVSEDDLVYVISFYQAKKLQRTQTFQVLGSQRLTELKDAFHCVSDQMPYSKINKSSFFFMENIFYNDRRSDEALDASLPIIEWYKARAQRHDSCRFKDLVSQKMEDYRWADLKLSVGRRYLYCHQADCEHVMIVEEVRSYNPVHDSLKKADFPMKIFQNKFRRRKCGICDKAIAKQIAFGDTMSPESPVLYCNECYQALHPHGHKDEFHVYPYIHEP